MTPDQLKLYNQLVLNEGKKNKPYEDTVGKTTIGIGRNLDDVGLSEDEIQYLWMNDIKRVEGDLDKHLSWWRGLDVIRQRVMIDLCFNMGIGNEQHGLRSFRNTLEAVRTGHYREAAAGLLSSKWAKQVKGRAIKLASMMETGNDAYPG
jgi:lysozyme